MSRHKFDATKADPDDPTTTRNNGARASGAEGAVRFVCKVRGEKWTDNRGDLEDEICYLIADLCHLCDREKFSVNKLIARAKRNWKAER